MGMEEATAGQGPASPKPARTIIQGYRNPHPRAKASSAVLRGWIPSNCWASSTIVFSPLIAASATFALKAGLWLRRGRFVIMAPVPGILPCSKAESHLSQLFRFADPPLYTSQSIHRLPDMLKCRASHLCPRIKHAGRGAKSPATVWPSRFARSGASSHHDIPGRWRTRLEIATGASAD